MADFKIKYGTSNQTITITVNSLGSNGVRESTVVSNTTDLFLDALVQLVIITGAGGGGYANVYVYASADGGTTYSAGATGSDASITLQSPPNLVLLGIITLSASATANSKVFSVASAFGGTLPEKWGIVVENKTAQTLGSSGNKAFYQGVYGQSV